jgi:hypothetical protein
MDSSIIKEGLIASEEQAFKNIQRINSFLAGKELDKRIMSVAGKELDKIEQRISQLESRIANL